MTSPSDLGFLFPSTWAGLFLFFFIDTVLNFFNFINTELDFSIHRHIIGFCFHFEILTQGQHFLFEFENFSIQMQDIYCQSFECGSSIVNHLKVGYLMSTHGFGRTKVNPSGCKRTKVDSMSLGELISILKMFENYYQPQRCSRTKVNPMDLEELRSIPEDIGELKSIL